MFGSIHYLKFRAGTSLVVQWWRLCAGDTRLIPGWGTKILHAAWHSQKKKKKFRAISRLLTDVKNIMNAVLDILYQLSGTAQLIPFMPSNYIQFSSTCISRGPTTCYVLEIIQRWIRQILPLIAFMLMKKINTSNDKRWNTAFHKRGTGAIQTWRGKRLKSFGGET